MSAAELRAAAQQGNAREVARLLAAGADPDAADVCQGTTALHLAAADGHTRVVRTLLTAGASPKQRGPDGMAPIHLAAGANQLAVIRLLLDAAPGTATAVDDLERTPLFIAAESGAAGAVALLLAAAPQTALTRSSEDDTFPLFVAAREGHDKVVRLLLEAAPEAALHAARFSQGSATPLLVACVAQHPTVVRQLLTAAPQAASVPSSQAAPITPLYAAAAAGRLDILSLILEAAPEAAVASTAHHTLPLPLHMVAATPQLFHGAAAAQLVVDAVPSSAATTAPVGGGAFTPLHIAASSGNAAVARVLVRAAPETVRVVAGSFQKTPLEVAVITAAELARLGPEAGEQFQPPSAYLETARPMLAPVPPDVSLPLLARFNDLMLPLFPEVALHWPLTAAQWAQVPAPCPGIGTALPAALQRSEAEAALLVEHLPATDSARLRTFALALHRSQRRLGVFLPGELAGRILSLFDA